MGPGSPENPTQEASTSLANAPNMFERIARMADEGIWTLDADGLTAFINDRGASILGYRPEEMCGRPAAEFGFTAFQEFHDGLYEGQTHGAERLELKMRRRDGSSVWISSSFLALHSDDRQCERSVAVFSDITKQMDEKAQGEARSLKEELLDSIHDGLFALNRDWRFIYLNEMAAGIVGKIPQELVGRNIWEEYPELLGTPIEFAYRSAMESGVTERFEAAGMIEDLWFEISVNPTPLGITVHSVDVTEKRNAQMALRDSEAKYRGLFENLHEAVFACRYILDEKGAVIDWKWAEINLEAERMLGQLRCEIIDTSASQLNDEYGIPDVLMSSVREARRTGRQISIESYYDPLLDRHYRVGIMPMNNDAFYMMAIDITGLKNAQSGAEDERARLQAILDSTPVAVGITDAEGGMMLENGVLEKIWCGRLSLGCVADYSMCRAWWPETGEPVRPEEWPAARALKGEASTATFDIQKFDGTRGAMIVSASPIFDKGGNVTGTAWTNQDISELRRAEEELKRSNADLQQFAYVASHDLQEPLRMVMAYLGLLIKRHGDELSPDAAEYVKTAIGGAERMRQLIDDLLTYSRIESKRTDRALVDMNQVASTVVSNLQVTIEDTGARVAMGPLPMVHVDGAQMTRVLQNLIGNAIKFHGPEPPRITIAAKRRSGEWVISVKDNGIGIDAGHKDDLFKMFHRLHTREEYEGTGIGLAITKKIVERNGGRIWFESSPGKGSTFYFTIPGMT